MGDWDMAKEGRKAYYRLTRRRAEAGEEGDCVRRLVDSASIIQDTIKGVP
ncbi:hypothetical protein ACFL5A_04820 [Gemmatimonadota bacterium]